MSGDLAVQYQKLTEWLLARRAVPESYPRLLVGIDAKVKQALDISVSDKAANALIVEHRESMTYYAARDIYEALAKTEAGQAKSFLGAHTDPATAKWKEVVNAYSGRNNLKWASGGRLLIQNVSYEIPSLKKHAQSCERQAAECTQRQAELTKAEAAAILRYQNLLKELGIQGFDPARELKAYAGQELPKVHSELADVLQASGTDLAEYYKNFVSHIVTAPPDSQLLPLIRAVAKGGHDIKTEDVERDVAQHRDALSASRLEAAAAAAAASAEADAGGGIDWGAMGGGGEPEVAATSGGIDFGAVDGGAGGGISWDFEVSSGDAGADAGGISWNFEVESGEGAVASTAEAGSGGIDWGGVSFEGLELGAEGDDTGAVGVELQLEAERFLENPAGRELLYQEVAEVEAFLQGRCAEGHTDDEQFPEGAKKSAAEVRALLEAANKAAELLTGKSTQRLLLLRSSQRYVAQQVKRIDIAKAQTTKPVAQRAKLEVTKGEQADEARRTRVELDKLRMATVKIQKEIESELSAYFKSTVRIVGDIAQI